MRLLSLSIRLTVFAICVGWLATKIEVDATLKQFETFSFWAALAAAALVIPSMIGYSWRLRYLLRNSATLGDASRATLIGIVFNNFLPIRGGELVKAIFLSRMAPIGFEKALVAVFWERFADLNAALIMILIIGVAFDLPVMLTTMGGVIFTIWVLIFAVKKYPDVVLRLLGLVPSKKLQNSGLALLSGLTDEVSVRRQIVINAQTIAIWFLLMLQCVVVLRNAAHLPLTAFECATVFAIATVFIMIPSAPANVGLMEAGVVIGASLFGIPHDQALAAAILLHIVQLAPASLVGLIWLIFHSDTTRLLLDEYHRRKDMRSRGNNI